MSADVTVEDIYVCFYFCPFVEYKWRIEVLLQTFDWYPGINRMPKNNLIRDLIKE